MTTANTTIKPTKALAKKILEVVDAGLRSGIGTPTPGQMCVEAAVCFAMGLPHSDNPPCVHPVVRAFKITLNDTEWSSRKARAKGLRRIAIAQLGSADTVDGVQFAKLLAEETIRRIVPIGLREAAKLNPKFAESLEAAAVRCEKEGTREAASSAAYAAAYAAASSSSAAAYAAAYAASSAASSAAYAAAYAASSAATSAATSAASSAASAAASAASDKVLSLMADIGVEVLKKCGSLGCKWLGLCD